MVSFEWYCQVGILWIIHYLVLTNYTTSQTQQAFYNYLRSKLMLCIDGEDLDKYIYQLQLYKLVEIL